MAQLIDTHCHIQSAGLTEGERTTRELWAKAPELTPETILSHAQDSGVAKMICVGCDLADSQLAVQFAASHDGCFASIGLHPHEAQHFVGQTAKLQTFAALAEDSNVVAIGECGLDYFYEHSPKAAQLEILRYQLQLAQDRDLPLIFHVREAFDDFWPVFEEFHSKKPLRGVLHSFTDNRANLERALSYGLFIGVNGIATFAKHDSAQAVYRAIPLEHLLLETDAPFLTPVPLRGKINEPKNIGFVADYLAQLKELSVEQLATATTANAKRLFGL